MDWEDVGKAVASAAPALGTALGGPVGGAVGAIVASLFGVEAKPDKVVEAIKADPEAFLKLRQLELDHARELRTAVLQAETARLAEINGTIRTEVASTDAYVRRMRPTFGYLMALTWAAQMVAIAYVIVADPAQAGAVVSAMANLGMIWTVGLSVLGIYVYRLSDEKRARPEGVGLLGALARRIAGWARRRPP